VNFTSEIFLFAFLPIFLLGYWLTPAALRNLVLTLGSYVFYAWWRPDFAVLLLLSSSLVFLAGRGIARGEGGRRRAWLLLALLANLGLLAYFKYVDLLIETLEAIGSGELDWEEALLPLGISFYTFQGISYCVDVYRREVEAARSYLDCICYLAMFPQLVAGPIVRFGQIREQLIERRSDLESLSTGAMLFMIGFSKKLLLADNLAPLADQVFADAAPGFIDAWVGVCAFALQIYFDFSGYTDMALGLGLLLGFRLPENFNSPYRSASIGEFWRRWHMSLSTWLKDYLYIPLGGNRGSRLLTCRNIAITMLLGGLWHGASWTFVLWGGFHALLLMLERAHGRRPVYSSLPRPLAILLTFVLLLLSWAIFRAETVDGLLNLYAGMFGFAGLGMLPILEARAVFAWAALASGLFLVFCMRRSQELARTQSPLLPLLLILIFLVALGQLASTSYSPFLYYRF
jgi:alginate O-acetyltransferase complex protein AlgI